MHLAGRCFQNRRTHEIRHAARRKRNVIKINFIDDAFKAERPAGCVGLAHDQRTGAVGRLSRAGGNKNSVHIQAAACSGDAILHRRDIRPHAFDGSGTHQIAIGAAENPVIVCVDVDPILIALSGRLGKDRLLLRD